MYYFLLHSFNLLDSMLLTVFCRVLSEERKDHNNNAWTIKVTWTKMIRLHPISKVFMKAILDVIHVKLHNQVCFCPVEKHPCYKKHRYIFKLTSMLCKSFFDLLRIWSSHKYFSRLVNHYSLTCHSNNSMQHCLLPCFPPETCFKNILKWEEPESCMLFLQSFG